MANKSIQAWKQQNQVLTATPSGAGTAEVVLVDGLIIIDVNGLASSETLTINTPWDFEIYDVWVITKKGGEVSPSTVTIKNNTTAITNSLNTIATKAIVRATTIDDTEAAFNAGDDDLMVVRGAQAAGDFMIYIKTGPQMSTNA